jgi:hypothetical protein
VWTCSRLGWAGTVARCRTAELLELGNLPFVTPYAKPTREEVLQYYRRAIVAGPRPGAESPRGRARPQLVQGNRAFPAGGACEDGRDPIPLGPLDSVDVRPRSV